MKSAPEVFRLTPQDRHSATWLRLKAHLEDKLATARVENEGDKDAIMTAKIRGRIGLLKALIALDQDDPVIE